MDTKLYLTVANCCDPLRASLSVDLGTSLFILQRLCGTTCRVISAVLRCCDFCVGLDCLVCTKLRGSVRGARILRLCIAATISSSARSGC